MRRGLQFSTILAGGLLLAPFAAQAQTQVLPGVIDVRPLPVEEAVETELRRQTIDVETEAPEKEEPAEEKPAVTLENIVFSGNTVLDTEVLVSVSLPYLEKPITEKDLAQLKYDVARAYYDRGYTLVKVVTPPQDVSDGLLEVTVYEGRIGEVVSKGGELINAGIAKAIAGTVQRGAVFSEAAAETLAGHFNDLHDVKAQINLKPGKKFGTTDLHVMLEREDEDRNYVQLDNYGSELTGRMVGTMHLEQGNVLGMGEQLSFDGRLSEDDLWSTQFGLQMPLPVDNVMLNLSYLHSENDIGDRLAALDASGETDSFRLGVSRAFTNTAENRFVMDAGLEARTHRSFLAGAFDTKDDIRRLFVGAQHLKRDENRVYYAAMELSKGISGLGASNRGDVGATRAQGDPDAWIFTSQLYGRVPVSKRGAVVASLSGQWASAPLLSSDLFALGGYGSVRGFELAKETGDSGIQASLEFRYDPDMIPEWRPQLIAFMDSGVVFNRLVASAQDHRLHSAGLGVEFTPPLLDDVFKENGTKLRLDWAHTFGGYSDTNVDDNRVYFRIVQVF